LSGFGQNIGVLSLQKHLRLRLRFLFLEISEKKMKKRE
jgi:hypothetical protein